MWTFRLFPEAASTGAREVDLLYFALIAISAFFMVVVFGPLIFFAIKYRRRSKADRTNPPHGSFALEMTWTAIPLFISFGLFTWGAMAYFDIERAPKNALRIDVVGKQWMWKLQHAEGKREIDELHVPVGQTVLLTMTSQDVIHSFYVPAFRVKQDVLPGRYTTEWFKPTRTGEYHLFCAEFCGTEHSGMIGRVVVMEPNAYEQWLTTGDVALPSVAAGQRLFTQLGCSGCHGDSSKIPAPRLEGIFGKPVPLNGGATTIADEKYIRDSILMPGAQIAAGYENLMPTFKDRITEEELMQVITYIRSLSETNTPAR